MSSKTPPITDMLCFSLYSASHAMNRFYKPILAELGLTYPQYLVLVCLWQSEPQTVGELCNSLKLETNTLTPLLKRLEKSGYIQRERDSADERKVFISLTNEGRQIQDRSQCISEQIIEAIGLSENSAKILARKIADVRHHISESS